MAVKGPSRSEDRTLITHAKHRRCSGSESHPQQRLLTEHIQPRDRDASGPVPDEIRMLSPAANVSAPGSEQTAARCPRRQHRESSEDHSADWTRRCSPSRTAKATSRELGRRGVVAADAGMGKDREQHRESSEDRRARRRTGSILHSGSLAWIGYSPNRQCRGATSQNDRHSGRRWSRV